MQDLGSCDRRPLADMFKSSHPLRELEAGRMDQPDGASTTGEKRQT